MAAQLFLSKLLSEANVPGARVWESDHHTDETGFVTSKTISAKVPEGYRLCLVIVNRKSLDQIHNYLNIVTKNKYNIRKNQDNIFILFDTNEPLIVIPDMNLLEPNCGCAKHMKNYLYLKKEDAILFK